MFYFGSNTKRDLSASSHFAIASTALALTDEYVDVRFFLLPSAPLFYPLSLQARKSRLWIGNQVISGTSRQDLTGEISAPLVKSLGSSIVMIGHGERRSYCDDEKAIAAQIQQAKKSRLRILYCVGENRVIKDPQKLRTFLRGQLRPLSSITTPLMLAYEPLFSIGVGGKPAAEEYVSQTLSILKEELDRIGKFRVPILYGGSVNSHNASSYAALPHCDGLFVGRSAWSARGFRSVFRAGYSGFQSKE
jgi:triosephosphate isomerase